MSWLSVKCRCKCGWVREGTGPDDDPVPGFERRRSRADGRAGMARAMLAARGIAVAAGFPSVPGFAELADHVIVEAATACVNEGDFCRRLAL